MFSRGTAGAQNLVVNGDFEAYNTCPAGFSAIDYSPAFTSFPWVQNWVRPTQIGSSDYFHTCATTAVVRVPNNTFGYQQPHSGKAYTGMYGFLKGGAAVPTYQEFISTKLPAPLKKDSFYCVSFYVSTTAGVSGGATQAKIAVNSIAAFISDTLPTKIPTPSMDPPRFIMNDTNIHLVDTSIWYEVRGRYQAKGGEQWITIGAFFDGDVPPFTYLTTGAPGSFINYVYIDDVSVSSSAMKYPTQRVQYCGDPVQLTSQSVAGPYKWNTGETGRSITVSAPGSYSCITAGGCTDMQDTIVVLPIPVSDTVDKRELRVCTAGAINLKLTPASGTRYKWSGGQTTREITVTTTGTYSCDVLRNCRIYRSTFEVVNNMPEAPVLRDTVICQYTDSPLLRTGYDDLVWYTAKGGPFTLQPAIPTAGQGQITLYASRKSGDCITARQPLTITIKAVPRRQEPQRLIRCNDRPSELRIGARTAADDQYEWSTGESTFQIPLPPADGQYTRTITNECGATVDTFEIGSGVCNDCVVFPNAFTPNGDGRNDEFRGIVRCLNTEYFLRVYNRWGEMIFVTSKPQSAWDGTYRGIPAMMGTYMYQCTLRNVITGEEFRAQGDVLLIR